MLAFHRGRFAACVPLMLLALVGCLPLHVAGQETDAPPSPQEAKALITQAFAQSKTAQSSGDYAQMIVALERAKRGALSDANAEYADSLLSWAHNRRGEALSKQSASLTDRERAATLDAEALAHFEAAVRLDGTRWKSLHNRGVSYAMVGKYDAAIADFTAALALRKDYASTWFNRAELYNQLGEEEKATMDYAQVLRLDPTDWQAHIGRGHALFRLGRYSQALGDYSRAVQLAPREPTAVASRGDAYLHLRQYNRAMADYRRAVQLNPECGRGYQQAAWLMATAADSQFRDPARALNSARKAIELDGENWRAIDTLAAALAATGQHDKAVEAQREALEKAPPGPRAELEARLKLYQRGKAFYEAPR